MIKIKRIISHTIFIFFLNCNGSGGCDFFNKNIDGENYSMKKEFVKADEIIEIDKPIVNQSPNIDTDKPVEVNVVNDDIPQIKEDEKIENDDAKKTIPKPTYIPYTNAPETLSPISPEYPKYELSNGVEGIVYIQFRIDTKGNVAESYIAKSSNNDNLDNAALNAVLSSKWQPAKNQGELVSVWQTLPFEFKLSQ